jgi:hypothetical protein
MAATSIPVNASSGEHMSLSHTLSAPVTMTNPVGGRDGQRLLLHLTQGGRGHNGVSWGSAYEFTTLPHPTLKTTVGHTDVLGFVHDAATGKWRYVARADHYGRMLPSQAWNA